MTESQLLALAALVCGLSSIALCLVSAYLTDGAWQLFVAALLLAVAMTAFLYASDRTA